MLSHDSLELLAKHVEGILCVLRAALEHTTQAPQAPQAPQATAQAAAQPVTAHPATIPPGAEEAAALEQVRAKLAGLARAGKAAQIRELIQSYGVDNLTRVPAEKLGELLEKAQAL